MTAPVMLALRRLRARLFSALLLAVAFGAAAALVGWSSIVAAHEHGTTVIAASHDADVIAAADVRLTLPSARAVA